MGGTKPITPRGARQQAPAPAPAPSLSPQQPAPLQQLLVLGSSVSVGTGASCRDRGWAALLAAEAGRRYAAGGTRLRYVNMGLGATTAAFWAALLQVDAAAQQAEQPAAAADVADAAPAVEAPAAAPAAAPAVEPAPMASASVPAAALRRCGWFWEAARLIGGDAFPPGSTALVRVARLQQEVRDSDVVLLSLSLGNDGLAQAADEADMHGIEREYMEDLRAAAEALRRLMRPGARLVLGGPYPNGDYGPHHLQVLQRVLADMRAWPCADHTVDFLSPELHDGGGRWRAGTGADAWHPNDTGHRAMARCVDLEAALGLPPGGAPAW